ncbi:MAG: hypothetical protein PHR28_02390 [candidate division Zixibacteria bacterium]|nr:hypothetical protein [candidate division Zixibacteria bacterium]
MTGRKVLVGLLCLAFCITQAVAGTISDELKAAQTDLRVFCPAMTERDIQWPVLLYLNQTVGAEVYIALFRPAPVFSLQTATSADGQFHIATIGRPETMTDIALVESLAMYLFPDRAPDLAVCGTTDTADSVLVASLVAQMGRTSAAESPALFGVKRVFFSGGKGSGKADIILDEDELCRRYRDKTAELGRVFGSDGPQYYRPEQIRRYFRLPLSPADTGRTEGFVSGLDMFRLPVMVTRQLTDSPVRRDLLTGLDRYCSYLRVAENQPENSSRQIQLISAAYREIIRFGGVIDSLPSSGKGSQLSRIAGQFAEKTRLALVEAIGLDWNSRLEMLKTPDGNVVKLMLDMQVTGGSQIGLSSLLLHLPGKPAVAIDTVSETIQPHQKFIRQIPIQWDLIDSVGAPADSLRFTTQISVGDMPLEFEVPLRKYADMDLGLAFLPGYTFLSPFTETDVTALAQPFEWQLRITKPYRSELKGKLTVTVPDGIVVGSFNPDISMAEGVTTKYVNLYLGAGRSMETDPRQVQAALEVGGQVVAETSAPVRVVRCAISAKTKIAFVPDPDGRLEDFLRMAKTEATPLTPHGLMLATLEKYGLIIIGPDPVSYQDMLQVVRPRFREYVKNGGKILILGQSFGLSDDIFDFSIRAVYTESPSLPRATASGHALFKFPYSIGLGAFDSLTAKIGYAWPARVSGGTELISAGELGSYLTVVTVGDGHVIYCGLPLLEMAARLDVEAIHLLANLMNFDHGD